MKAPNKLLGDAAALPRLTLKQLGYFVAASHHQSVIRAAEELGLSPASVSAGIAQLEALLGVQLFVRRHARGLVLTAVGRELASEARNLLEQARAIESLHRRGGSSMEGRLELGCLVSFAPYLVPPLLRSFLDRHPKDMTPQLTRIRSSDAQATVLWATGPGQAISVKNFAQLGLKHPLYLSHAANDFNFVRLAGEAANGVLIPSSKIYVTASLAASDPQKPAIERFAKDYEAKYGKPPATFAGNGYDATMMIVEAIKRAGTDRAKLRDAIEATKGHVGVTAVYSYSPTDHFGAQADSVVMLTVTDGKFTLAK